MANHLNLVITPGGGRSAAAAADLTRRGIAASDGPPPAGALLIAAADDSSADTHLAVQATSNQASDDRAWPARALTPEGSAIS